MSNPFFLELLQFKDRIRNPYQLILNHYKSKCAPHCSSKLILSEPIYILIIKSKLISSCQVKMYYSNVQILS